MTLKHWIKNELRYYPKRFKVGVKNLIKWFPIIWKDRDYDHTYILAILKFKLKKQSKFIADKGVHADAWRDARNMNICVKLLDRIQNEFYSGEFMDFCELDFKWMPTGKSTDGFKLDVVELSNKYQDFFDKYPRIYKRICEEGYPYMYTNDDNGKAIAISKENHERAKRLLFKIMEEELEGWWD